jgi:hypothetical protein
MPNPSFQRIKTANADFSTAVSTRKSLDSLALSDNHAEEILLPHPLNHGEDYTKLTSLQD